MNISGHEAEKLSLEAIGGLVAAQSSCYAPYFSTTSGPDTTVGTVIIGPPNGSVNVDINAYIRLQFSKPVDRTSINSTTVEASSGGNAISGSSHISFSHINWSERRRAL